MKLRDTRAEQRRPHRLGPARIPAKEQQETDFTAEGSPPPGKVGAGRPALPDEDGGPPALAVASKHAKR